MEKRAVAMGRRVAPIEMRAVGSSGVDPMRYMPRAALLGNPRRLHRMTLAMMRDCWRGIIRRQRDIHVLLRGSAESWRRNAEK
jgi:hypothetical protein